MATRYRFLMSRWAVVPAVMALAVVAAMLATALPVGAQSSSTILHPENSTGPVATFTATDPEGDTVSWSLTASADDNGIVGGDVLDQDDFVIEGGVLRFSIGDGGDPPDYEDPMDSDSNNIYKVVVVASDGTNMSYHKVTVAVTDVANEPGKVTLTATPDVLQSEVEAELMAAVTDGDGDTSATKWQWYRSSSKNCEGTAISGATAATYTLAAADADNYVCAKATYTAGGESGQTASQVSEYKVLAKRDSNTAPVFSQTTIGRNLNEGDKGRSVGRPVTATDDGPGLLTYTLGGDDVARFGIDKKTGQITTKVKLSHGALAGADDNCTAKNSCEVTVTAMDSAGLSSSTSATVTIALQNVDDKPKFGAEDTTADSEANLMKSEIAENAMGDDLNVAEYTATAGGDMIMFSLRGADASKFKLTNPGAAATPPAYSKVLTFMAAQDYENPTDSNRDNVYQVTVRASVGSMHTDLMVRVTVTNVNEEPKIMEGGLSISGLPSMNFAEGGTGAVGMFTAVGPMKDRAMWTLEGADSMYFSVRPTRGAMTELMFGNAPDYEMPRGMDMSDTNTNTYMVMLKANDGTSMDTQDVTVTVTNMDEEGMVTLPSLAPMVGTPVTASLSDPDGSVTGETWQWSRSMNMAGEFMNIDEATMMSYTPVTGDVGYYLMAKAMYTDGHGSGKTAMATTAKMVTTNGPPMFSAETATREVAENTDAGENIGMPVTATDPDTDTLTYSLSGADAMYFAIGASTGQLMTKAALDYEMPRGEAMADDNTNSYMVTVTATDPDQASDTIMVTIMVTDVEMSQELLDRYDTDGDEEISKEEALAAISDYIFSGQLTKDEALQVIALYLFS